VQYVPGGKDQVTVWLDPDLGPGATEAGQSESLTTRFAAEASFNQIRLRHGGGGDGWIFSEMAIATSFSDFVIDSSGIKSGAAGLTIGRGQLPFTFRVWQREQGLPQNFVRALAQTADGYVWVGSDAGVSRFDGVRFVSFGLPEGFQAGPVQTMLGATDGALWIGSVDRGLWRWQNDHFTAFSKERGLPSDSINALAEDGAGRIWIGTEGGLAVWQNGNAEPLDTGNNITLIGKSIAALFSDRKGALWIGAKDTGLFRMEMGQIVQVHDPVFDYLLQDVHCLLVDHEGRVWVGAGDASVLCYESGQWRQYRFPRHLARHYVSALAEDGDGTVWAGSVSEGLFEFKRGKLVAINAGSGLSDNLVETLLVDREGILWVGTHSGLNRLRPKNLSVIGYNEGLGNGPVQSLAEVSPGVIWAGKSSEGLYVWDGRYFRPLPVADVSPSQAGALLVAKDGSCWMGGARGLLHFKNPRQVETDPPVAELPDADVSALAQDRSGRIWAGTRQGALWFRENGQWQAHSRNPGGHAVTAIVSARDGSLWVGTAGDGLFEVATSTDGHWRKRNGPLSDWVRTLYLDAESTLWIGTGGGGLSRLRDGSLATFTTREGLPDNTISQILQDDTGKLWLGGDRGIVRVGKAELNDVAAKKIAAVSPEIYGRAEGMLSEECISGFFPMGLRTKSDLLWFPTQEGLVVIDPHHQITGAPAPSVVLEETLVDGVADPSPSLHLGPGKHWLEFRYTGLDFDAPERVRFRYRLEGLNSDWVDGGAGRSASFPYVPYGNYKFEVEAGDGEGGWNSRGAGVSVAVKPYFWQTWWFRVPAALALLGAIAAAARLAEKRKLQRQLDQLEQERALAQERERIARDLHDDLGSSLARISLLSGLLRADHDNPTQVSHHATKISQSADQTVRALEEIVWAVRPGSDSLQSLVEYIAHFANELFEGGEIRCRLDLPHDLPARPLPPDVRHNVFLIVKEALTNALKHAGAREVLVRAEATKDGLDIVVQDDGKGFAENGEKRGNGLDNMRRRAQALGETVAVQSTPGRGTVVRLSLHFPAVHSNGKAAV
jgi:ligand-binding sensor domain-containing protein/signal transduction histidine kinase